MKPQSIPAIVLSALVLLAPASALADWVILTSGEKFQTDRTWSEDGRLKFRLNGLVVSVPESDVAKVVTPDTAADTAAPMAAAPSTLLPEVPATTPAPLSRKQRLQSALQLPPPQTTQEGAGTKGAKPTQPTKAPRAREKQKSETLDGGHPAAPDQPAATPFRGVFRNLAWGMRPTSIPGLLHSQTTPAYGGVDEFYHPDEVLQLGAAPLDGIVYGFWQNRLYTITVWADGRPRFEKLRQWVLDTYGPGQPSKTGAERQVWYGNGSDRLLEFDEALNTGIFWMRSEKLHARIKQMQTQ